MKHAQQGKLDAKTWIVLIFALVFSGFLLFASRPHVYRPGPNTEQLVQFNALNAAIELFANEFDGYPPSDANDRAGQPYCGAMKLAEALMGQDLLGFHTESVFRRDGLDIKGLPLYLPGIDDLHAALREHNLRIRRKGPFVQADNARAFRLMDIYGKGNTGPFPEDTLVLCDTYRHRDASGEKTGMPILYYRANPLGTTHDIVDPDNPQNIYSYKDNQALIALGVPGTPGETHPLADPKRFYLNTQNLKTPLKPEPYRRDTFLLISAGQDGLYGTADDICNFDWKYRKR